MAGRPSKLPIYRRMNFASIWYFSSPRYCRKDVEASGLPRRKAVRPFSAKAKSKRLVTATSGVPSCSCCLMRSEPPTWRGVRVSTFLFAPHSFVYIEVEGDSIGQRLTKPIAHFSRRARSILRCSCEILRRAGDKVPSTSNKQITPLRGRSFRSGYDILSEGVYEYGFLCDATPDSNGACE